MQSDAIGNYRIASQHINAGKFKKPADVVAHLGAMQAQDFPMARWAVGLRCGANDDDVLAAYDKGEIIRTHLLRPTWHLVANRDIDWMTRLTAPVIIASLRGQHEQRGLGDAIFKKSHSVIEKAITASGPLIREELLAALKKGKIDCAPQSYPYLLYNAELSRVICSGPMRGKKTTYALYAERIKATPLLKRDEALARLAKRYFTSHGPATFADFTWWSGLKMADAHNAYAAVEKKFSREKIAGTTYLMAKGMHAAPDKIYLLPAFDEFLISYADRTAVLAQSMAAKVATKNGLFRATVVANGITRGIWKREFKKGKLVFAAEYFGKADAKLKAAVQGKVKELEKFSGISHTSAAIDR